MQTTTTPAAAHAAPAASACDVHALSLDAIRERLTAAGHVLALPCTVGASTPSSCRCTSLTLPDPRAHARHKITRRA